MRILCRLAAYSLRHKKRLAAAYAAGIGSTLSYIVIPKLLGTAIDEVIARGLQRDLLLVAGTILLVAVIRGALSYAEEYFYDSISLKVSFDLRSELFRKLQDLSFGIHDRQRTGALMAARSQAGGSLAG